MVEQAKNKVKRNKKRMVYFTVALAIFALSSDQRRVFSVQAQTTEQEEAVIVAMGTLGVGGAPWTIDENGVIRVQGGEINRPTTFRQGSSGSWLPSAVWQRPGNFSNLEELPNYWEEIMSQFPSQEGIGLWHFDVPITRIVFEQPIKATYIRGLFSEMPYLVKIEGLENIDTSAIVDMSNLFLGSSSLRKVSGLSSWDTSNVEDMFNLFHQASIEDFTEIMHWNVERVKDLSFAFMAVNAYELDLSNWRPLEVRSLNGTFVSSHFRELRLAGWEVRKLEDLNGVFATSLNVRTIDLSDWETENLRSVNSAFLLTPNLSDSGLFGVSDWHVPYLETMNSMFVGSGLTEVDLSGWDTPNLQTMNNAFAGMPNLQKVNLWRLRTHEVSSMTNAFASSGINQLTLGENFRFLPGSGLMNVPYNETFTGNWQNIGAGTLDNPTGQFTLTTTELTTAFDGATMADTWVWQRVLEEDDNNDEEDGDDEGNVGGEDNDEDEGDEDDTSDIDIGFIDDNAIVVPEPIYPEDSIDEEDFLGGTRVSTLALLRAPSAIHFGTHRISAVTENEAYLVLPALPRNEAHKLDALSIWDGRVENDDWQLQVRASAFENHATNTTLTGARLEFGNVRSRNNADSFANENNAIASDFYAVNTFTLHMDNLPQTILRSYPSAKAQTDLYWNVEDAHLILPSSNIGLGDYRAVIHWTLVGEPSH